MTDDLQRSIYDLVHNYTDGKTRGAMALAPRVGMNPTTLSNKVNPNMETHHLGLIESIPLQLISGDFRILNAYAQTLNHIVIPAINFKPNVTDMELLNLYCSFNKELGEMAQELSDALEDGRITRSEIRGIRKEGLEAITVFFQLLQRLEAICDA